MLAELLSEEDGIIRELVENRQGKFRCLVFNYVRNTQCMSRYGNNNIIINNSKNIICSDYPYGLLCRNSSCFRTTLNTSTVHSKARHTVTKIYGKE